MSSSTINGSLRVEETANEGQIILLGKPDIEEEDKGEDEEAQRHHTSEESEDEASHDSKEIGNNN
jgi:hypothetical protein